MRSKSKRHERRAQDQADLDAERFAELHDFEEYKDAVMSDTKDPKQHVCR